MKVLSSNISVQTEFLTDILVIFEDNTILKIMFFIFN